MNLNMKLDDVLNAFQDVHTNEVFFLMFNAKALSIEGNQQKCWFPHHNGVWKAPNSMPHEEGRGRDLQIYSPKPKEKDMEIY